MNDSVTSLTFFAVLGALIERGDDGHDSGNRRKPTCRTRPTIEQCEAPRRLHSFFSSEWGVKKPSKGFFARAIDAAAVPERQILYVGDRLDNDIASANSMGIRTAFLMRDPWAHIQRHRPEAELADLKLDSLEQLRDIFVDAAKLPKADCGDGGDAS